MLRFIHRHYRSCVVLVSLVWFGCYFAFDLGLATLALLDCGCLALLFVLASGSPEPTARPVTRNPIWSWGFGVYGGFRTPGRPVGKGLWRLTVSALFLPFLLWAGMRRHWDIWTP